MGSKVTYSSKHVGKQNELAPANKLGVNSPRSKQQLPTMLKGSANSMLGGEPLDESEDQEVEDEYTIDEGLSSIQNVDEIKSGTLSPPVDNLISGSGVPLQNTDQMATDVKLGKNDQILIEGRGVFMKHVEDDKPVPQTEKKGSPKKLLNYDTFESSSDD